MFYRRLVMFIFLTLVFYKNHPKMESYSMSKELKFIIIRLRIINLPDLNINKEQYYKSAQEAVDNFTIPVLLKNIK